MMKVLFLNIRGQKKKKKIKIFVSYDLTTMTIDSFTGTINITKLWTSEFTLHFFRMIEKHSRPHRDNLQTTCDDRYFILYDV